MPVQTKCNPNGAHPQPRTPKLNPQAGSGGDAGIMMLLGVEPGSGREVTGHYTLQ